MLTDMLQRQAKEKCNQVHSRLSWPILSKAYKPNICTDHELGAMPGGTQLLFCSVHEEVYLTCCMAAGPAKSSAIPS